MEVNVLAIGLASVAQFIIGAVWYMPVFGKLWGEIHGFDRLSKADQANAQKDMMPLLGVQFGMTIVTTVLLSRLMQLVPDYSVYTLVLILWVGFHVPVQVSGVIFGGTDSKWVVKKSAIQAGGSLLCLLAGAAILSAL